MVGDHQPGGAVGQPHQRAPQQRRGAHVEAPGPVGGEESVQLRGGHIHHLPVGFDVAHDELDRLAALALAEPHAKVRVPPQQHAQRLPEALRVDVTVQFQHQLRVVDLVGIGVVQRVEPQPLL
ncbi:hypothetical protein GCM10009545_19320 [Saccharopolyspora thermophila]|uniref:Uncharacterized protein n=1 Tax=Saccharopolyspora thermophila TaxID=89367 RepID=A0ABN1CE72_9PSEU